jgi:hypothetical protein
MAAEVYGRRSRSRHHVSALSIERAQPRWVDASREPVSVLERGTSLGIPMIILYAVVVLAAVFAIAAVVVGREARRLDAEPPKATFDLEEATEWVGNHLPFEVTAVLSYEDVRRILEWNIDYLRAKGVSAPGQGGNSAHQVVVDRDELAEFVLDRAGPLGAPYSRDQVEAVLDAQFSYFDAIGAIGPEAGPDEQGEA